MHPGNNTDHPLVSIITVNYNNAIITGELMASLRKISYPNLEVIVVDNASAEDPTQVINREYPDAIVIRSQENLGFAGGNNLGIKAAKGEFCSW